MKYKVYDWGISLIDSYLVPKARFSKDLQSIKNLHPNNAIWGRSDLSLRREWGAHNLAYALNFKRERTKDCDLNIGQKWYVRLAYGVVGTIALWVIK